MRHLDLGCGRKPRNPYGRDELYGVDVTLAPSPDGRFQQANLAVGPIPFPDNYFDSVSAYDFLEHIPRVLPSTDGTRTRTPFIEVMDEIWRVLVPGGLLYAQTPAVPSDDAFGDPTHVNFIAWGTHCYFTRPHLRGHDYGGRCDFEVKRHLRFKPRGDYESLGMDKLSRLRQWLRSPIGRGSHLLWEFIARKG